jgi:ketosteroid isomerase-like protein
MSFLLLMASTLVPAATVEDQVKEAEKAWAAATSKGDFATLDKVLANDLVYSHSNAEIDTKQSFIDNLKTKVRTYHAVTYDSMIVKVVGNTAILSAKGGLDVTTRGTRAQVKVAFLHAFVKQDGRWQLLGHQSARLQ